MKSGIHCGIEEVNFLSVRVKTIEGTSIHEILIHILKCCEQEVIELLLIFSGVIHDLHAGATFVGGIIWGIGNTHIRLLTVHQLFHIF